MQTRRLELFTTIHTEGAILPVDLLQRILDGDSSIDGTTPGSYHLGSGEKINEAVNRSWNRLQGLWLSFMNAKENLKESDTGTTLTRDKWLLHLFQELGYGRLRTGKAIEHENRIYDISHLWHNVPIHLVSFRLDLDKRQRRATGASKSSPHSMVQELLNASDEYLWGFVSNGTKLRILRDNRSLTRQAYVEFDIEGMMNGEVYSDFVLLWMLCHQSRVEADKPEECLLEKWSQTAQEQGTRALDQLRNGVEQAIRDLGRGFLSHASNSALKEKLKSGALPAQEYYRQLFRLVYRLLFLFVAEDRNLLLHPAAGAESRERYNTHYSVTRLRSMASRLRGGRHVDVWEQVRLIMDILSGDSGYDPLGLPALGGYLFSDEAIPDLHDCSITNNDFLSAVRALAFIVDRGTLRPVDYRNLRSEEFGSVYESLLERHPIINADAGTFELRTAAGNERKTTASYYTHDSLVQCLLDSALDPVLDEACGKPDPAKAILALKVCDFASGSGHFLTAAAHRMAKRLAAIRTEEDEPAPDAIRTALRDVIGHCIYGVDINPMAVELCKVALWMEALEAGKPLSFLDHHIRCGNSLIGATPALMKKGIPDEAFTAIEGDDKSICREYKKLNRQERERLQTTLFDHAMEPWQQLGNLTTALMTIDDIPDDTMGGVRRKQKEYEEFVRSASSIYGRFLADVWCASFVWKKTKEFPYPITEEVFRNIERTPFSAPIWLKEEVERLSKEYQFFHWQLAFPDVFFVDEKPENEQTGWSGGFDILLGNPPWEMVVAESVSKETPHFLREQAFYKLNEYSILSGRRDLYKLFLVKALDIICDNGIISELVPLGIFFEEEASEFRKRIFDGHSVHELRHFQNVHKSFFPDVHASYRFCGISYARKRSRKHRFSTVSTNPTNVSKQDFIEVDHNDYELYFGIERAAVSYNNLTYGNLHHKIRKTLISGELDRYVVVAEFHASTDSKCIFKSRHDDSDWIVPKNRTIHQYDHHFAESEAWVKESSVATRAIRKGLEGEEWLKINPRLLYRDIARSDDERTMIACLSPVGFVSTYDTPMVIPQSDRYPYPLLVAAYCGYFNSFLYDFMIRPYVDKHIKRYVIRRVPWFANLYLENVLSIVCRVIEIMSYDNSMSQYLSQIGLHGSIPTRDQDGKEYLRNEIDALIFYSYGVNREEVDYIMDTFPIVRKKDEAKYGEYRTKRVILEIYDEMKSAMESGGTYKTRLDPPPADERVAHTPEMRVGGES